MTRSNVNSATITHIDNKHVRTSGTQLSLKTSLLIILSLFVVGLLLVASINLRSALTSTMAAGAMRTNNDIGDLFLASAGALAAERGFTNGPLNAAAVADAQVTTQLAALRQRADTAIQRAIEAAAAGADFTGRDTLLARVRADYSRLVALRQDIDRQLMLPGADRNGEIVRSWVPAATALIMSSQELRIAAQIVPANALARSQLMLDLKQAMWVMSEYAGRERAMIAAIIARKGAIEVGDLTALAEYRGRLDQSWGLVQSYAGRDFANKGILAAISAADAEFFGAYEQLRGKVYAAGTSGTAYPVSSEEWIAAATRGIDSLLALSDSVSTAAHAYIGAVEDDGRFGVAVSVGVLVAAVALGAFSFVIVVNRITRPIERLTDTMARLSEGDLDAPLPPARRHDEIGRMIAAVAVFRDAGLENRRLEAEAENGRTLSERERRERERQKALEAEQLQLAIESIGTGLVRLAEGDVAQRIDTPFAGALDKLRTDFNGSVAKLEQALVSVGESARAIHSGSQEISAATNDLAQRTERQAASVEETAAAVEQMAANLRESSKRASEAGALSSRARQHAELSGAVVDRAVAAMDKISASSREIGNIIALIDEIAFQTNLLALNAGVEAARAGEAGKGFAVVAQEVRELAQRSAKAAKEIKTLVTGSAGQIDAGVALVGETGEALKAIVGEVLEVNRHVAAIVEAAREQSGGLEEINRAVSAMEQNAQHNAAMVEESSAAARNLAGEAASLNGMLAQFRLGEGAAAPAVATAKATVQSPARSLIRRVGNSFAGGAAAAREEWAEF